MTSLPTKTQIFTAGKTKHAVVSFSDAQTKTAYIKTLQSNKLTKKDVSPEMAGERGGGRESALLIRNFDTSVSVSETINDKHSDSDLRY